MKALENQPSRCDILEKSIIGCSINNPVMLEEAVLTLTSDDFLEPKNKTAWNVLISMRNGNEPIDCASVLMPLQQSGIDSAYINEVNTLWQDSIDSAHSRTLRIEQLVSFSDRYYASQKLNGIMDRARKGEIKDGSAMACELKDLAEEVSRRHQVATSGYVGDTLSDDINSLAQTAGQTIHFGIPDIDRHLGGLGKGHYIILSARTGVGKTAMMIQTVVANCKRHETVCIATLEMPRQEMVHRLMANVSNVAMKKINHEEMPEEKEFKAIVDAMVEIKSWKLMIVDKPNMKLSDIEKVLAQAKAQGKPIRLMVVDHFGLITPDKNSKSRYEDYTLISNKIKQLAKQYECTFLVLAQINRNIDKYTKPTPNDLRDTGSLEQDADKIIFLHSQENDETIVHVNIAKNRQGKEGETDLNFYGSTMRFYGRYQN